MANIDQLTVLSTDGASELVKNVTRTVTEAGSHGEGPDRHRHPGPAQQGDGWHEQRRGARPPAGRSRSTLGRSASGGGTGRGRPLGRHQGQRCGGTRRRHGASRRRAARPRRPHDRRVRDAYHRADPPGRRRAVAERSSCLRAAAARRRRRADTPRFETPAGRRRARWPTPTAPLASAAAARAAAAATDTAAGPSGPASAADHPRDHGRGRRRPPSGVRPDGRARDRALRQRSAWPSSSAAARVRFARCGGSPASRSTSATAS